MFIENYGDMKIGNFQQYLISYRLKSPLFSQVSPVYRKTQVHDDGLVYHKTGGVSIVFGVFGVRLTNIKGFS